jgi:serine/threonine protein kinase
MGSNICCSFSKADEIKIETLNHPLSSKREQNDSQEEVLMAEIVLPGLAIDLKTSNEDENERIVVQKRINMQKAVVLIRGEEKLLVTVKKENIQGDFQFFKFVEKCKQLDSDKFCVPEEVWEEEDCFQIVTQVPNGESVFDFYLKNDEFSESQVIGFVKEIVTALILSSDILSNLNPEEVYFNSEKNIKLLPFITPSNLFKAPSSNASDTMKNGHPWTLGVIIYIMLCGKSPFKQDYEAGQTPVFSFPNKHWDSISTCAKNFIMKLLSINSEKRPSLTDMLKDSWLTEKQSKKNNLKLRKDLKGFLDKEGKELAVNDLKEYFSSYFREFEPEKKIFEVDFFELGKGFNSKEAARVEKKMVLTQLILNYMGDATCLDSDMANQLLAEFGCFDSSDVVESEISVGEFADFVLNLLEA